MAEQQQQEQPQKNTTTIERAFKHGNQEAMKKYAEYEILYYSYPTPEILERLDELQIELLT